MTHKVYFNKVLNFIVKGLYLKASFQLTYYLKQKLKIKFIIFDLNNT